MKTDLYCNCKQTSMQMPSDAFHDVLHLCVKLIGLLVALKLHDWRSNQIQDSSVKHLDNQFLLVFVSGQHLDPDVGLTAQEQVLLLYDIKLQCLQNISEHNPAGKTPLGTFFHSKTNIILMFVGS